MRLLDNKRLVVVMATVDEVAIAIADSILQNAGVPYQKNGTGLRKFGSQTFLGASLGPLMGETILKVDMSDFVAASELLHGLTGAR